MARLWMVVACSIAVLTGPAYAQGQTPPGDDVRKELAALAERVGKLEAENATLKQRNESLERRVSELEPRAAGAGGAPAMAAVTAPAPTPVPEVVPAPTQQPWYETVKVSGLLFGDAYAVLANHDSTIEDRTGFWIRRGYLAFDAALASEWSGRLRFEINSPGDFTTNGKLEPFAKDAYLAWKRDRQELYLGLSPSPTFDFVESFWGQRPVEKTPLDLYRVGSSRDFGIAYRGAAYDGRVFYHAMLGNGSGDGSETNKGKKVMAGLGFKPTDGLVAQLYADYEDRPGATDRNTWQAFVGWKDTRSRYGLQYAAQKREVEAGPDIDVAVASAFGVWQLTQKGSLVARYDRNFDGYPDADQIAYLRVPNDVRFDLAILAWEQLLQPKISLIPNIEYVMYRDTNGLPAPDDDFYGRLTLSFEF